MDINRRKAIANIGAIAAAAVASSAFTDGGATRGIRIDAGDRFTIPLPPRMDCSSESDHYYRKWLGTAYTLRVYCDGEKLRHCVSFDRREGWADCLDMVPSGDGYTANPATATYVWETDPESGERYSVKRAPLLRRTGKISIEIVGG